MPTLISEFFRVSGADLEAAGAFDAFIDLDSQLHVDPHLLTGSTAPEMQDARAAITRYFEGTIVLLQLCDEKHGALWDTVVERLAFEELKGVSLGYSADEGDGSAVGPGLARTLATRAFEIVKAGEQDPRIFELVGLFTEAFGPDRISDVVLRIAESQFAAYTARIAAAVGIPTSPVVVGGATYAFPCTRRGSDGGPCTWCRRTYSGSYPSPSIVPRSARWRPTTPRSDRG